MTVPPHKKSHHVLYGQGRFRSIRRRVGYELAVHCVDRVRESSYNSPLPYFFLSDFFFSQTLLAPLKDDVVY